LFVEIFILQTFVVNCILGFDAGKSCSDYKNMTYSSANKIVVKTVKLIQNSRRTNIVTLEKKV
jgi:hypothetical protein